MRLKPESINTLHDCGFDILTSHPNVPYEILCDLAFAGVLIIVPVGNLYLDIHQEWPLYGCATPYPVAAADYWITTIERINSHRFRLNEYDCQPGCENHTTPGRQCTDNYLENIELRRLWLHQVGVTHYTEERLLRTLLQFQSDDPPDPRVEFGLVWHLFDRGSDHA